MTYPKSQSMVLVPEPQIWLPRSRMKVIYEQLLTHLIKFFLPVFSPEPVFLPEPMSRWQPAWFGQGEKCQEAGGSEQGKEGRRWHVFGAAKTEVDIAEYNPEQQYLSDLSLSLQGRRLDASKTEKEGGSSCGRWWSCEEVSSRRWRFVQRFKYYHTRETEMPPDHDREWAILSLPAAAFTSPIVVFVNSCRSAGPDFHPTLIHLLCIKIRAVGTT